MSVAPLGQLPRPDWIRPISSGGRAVFDLLFRRQAVAQSDIVRLLALSQSSGARLVGEFARAGMVTLASRKASGPGNPSAMVALAPDYAYTLGVAVVGDAVAMAIVDFTGANRAYASVAMPDMAPERVVPELRRLQQRLIAESGIDPRRLIGAGVGMCGYFVGDPLRICPPPLLAPWATVDPVAILREALGLPVLCDNDATAATVHESLLGAGRTCPTFAYCHLTNGFGGGLVIDGKPVRSWMANAGDFGGVWWLLDRGYPNLDALLAAVNAAGGRFATVEAMVGAITRDTPGVEDWLAAAVVPFGMLVTILGHVVSPEKVVIGGRIPHDIAAELAARIVPPQTPLRHDVHFPLPQVVASRVEGDTVALGAGLLPLLDLFF
ncbi:ROK family protein [Sphingomonas sp. CV7422]|uniref:ROK family protein n=1 Tax=Sphingomonas sp. CV7422 TaxID=3018036 RepID=UPI0022FDB117|nr:ROK family protein [Sphingomonas sp. CV7422]